ncbi:MAG TPA: carboxyl transferase domain-containing protein [Syntrophales bacterium]|nr:carboxyl transferase domain-containing protein [Syntrophales bacterium]HPI56478.1 carboxyl transferase domain-containing protein [Syntrophales bacterium]HPN25101.1 carboxyl transferase domain-containing protein [Syntrophales bacterium]HQM29156.1 carboxyl transferase domain-containing protein [Syntrophales bacterium]
MAEEKKLTRAERLAKEKEANLKHWEEQDAILFKHREEAYNIGGPEQLQRLAKQNKKPMRAMIDMLVDPGTEFYEVGLDAGYNIGKIKLYGGEIYESEKRSHIPGAGLVTGVGVVHGKDCMIFANENRYAAGTYFPITLKKHMRAQAIAERLRLPCIYIADSGGINLPLQLGCFADDGHFGSMFYNMCRMSAMGIKQYTLSTGGNTAGGAYIVYLASESIMIEKLAFAFLAGPPMVKSAIGETVSPEDLGGAYVHTQHSGGCDHFVRSQEEGIKKLRDIIEFEPGQNLYCERKKSAEPKFDFKEMMRNNPINTYQGINIKESLKCLADDSYIHEYKPTYGLNRGETIVAGKMWLKGLPVGVIASSSNGVIYIEAARKATEWMIRCGNSNLPVLFMQGSPGYMVGKSEEWGGIGKYGSDMVRTCSVLNVPKIQYVIGPDHGAANYGMCGRAFRPVFCFTNMRGRTTVMSGETAGFIVESVRRKNIIDKGQQVNEEEMAKFRQMMRDRYDAEGHPFLTGSLLFHDGVIAFSEARNKLARALELCYRAPIGKTDWGDLKV